MSSSTPLDPRIVAAEGALEEAQARSVNLESVLWELYDKVLQENGVDTDKHLIVDVHECPTSPIKICVYHVDDPCQDDCIYCHNPRERK